MYYYIKMIIGRSVKILNKQVKNLSIRATIKYKNEIQNFLDKKKINYKIDSTGDIELDRHNETSKKWGIPPNLPNLYTKTVITFYIPLEYEKLLKDNFKLKESSNKGSYYFKDVEKEKKNKYLFIGEKKNKYPIYVVSFGRYEQCFYTISNLEKMKLNYYICIQKKEEKEYNKMLKENNFVKCLGLVISVNTTQGGYKQRQKCITDATNKGFSKCWILDDNINGWVYNNNGSHKITNGLCFSLLEDFMDNIKEPVGILSHNYTFDIRINQLMPPFNVNKKNYSSLLLNIDLLNKNNIKWRLKYNEDVDLTLQCLSKKIYTVGTNFFSCNKLPTLSCKGGNTTSIYDQGKKFNNKFDLLFNTWKNTSFKNEITKTIKHKDNRTHHSVNYKNITKIMNMDNDITPIKTYTKEKTLKEFGIKKIYN
jgi:hypothetical protein